MIDDPARTALHVADWRRSVFALYDRVRDTPEPAAAHELWRRGRDRLLAEHPATPLLPRDRPGFAGAPVAAYDPAWRFTCAIEPAEAGSFDFTTGTDGVVTFERIGRVQVADAGTLDVWRLTSYGGGIFIPFRDASAGTPGGTYGGGRYLIDTIKGADLGADPESGTIVLDFNFAYNPSCAYDPAWACPLAPLGNRLAVPVRVGELYG